MQSTKRKLTDQQACFVEEYLVDLNATQAAIRAGYSARNADKIGPELLGKTRVAEAIDEAKALRRIRTEVKQEHVLRELLILATQDIDNYVIDDDGNVQLVEHAPVGAKRAISSIQKKVRTITKGEEIETIREVRVWFWNKNHALELLGKHLAMFTDKIAQVGADGTDRPILTPEERIDRLMALAQQVTASRINDHTPPINHDT